jgi:hypothetical protein
MGGRTAACTGGRAGSGLWTLLFACFAGGLLGPFGAETSFFDTFLWLVLLADFTVFLDDGL